MANETTKNFRREGDIRRWRNAKAVMMPRGLCRGEEKSVDFFDENDCVLQGKMSWDCTDFFERTLPLRHHEEMTIYFVDGGIERGFWRTDEGGFETILDSLHASSRFNFPKTSSRTDGDTRSMIRAPRACQSRLFT